MNPTKIIAAAFAVAAIAAPGAFASKPSGTPSPNKQTTASELPGPNAPLSALTQAYGRYCQDHSKKHVPGEKGTPFSQCVTAMAKAAHGKAGKSACASLSKKHIASQKGTPFSCCVAAARRLQKDQHTHT